MKALLLSFFVAAASASGAEAYSCFTEHVRDAIHRNRERAPRYEALSQGTSRAISRKLILNERLTIPLAWALEKDARTFTKAGIPVLCADFISMDQIPAFQDRFPFPAPKLSEFKALPVKQWKSELTFALRHMGFKSVHDTVSRQVGVLDREPQGYHCMVRHVLESVGRVAYLAPQYERKARARGLRRSPLGVSKLTLELHLQGLGIAADLDRMAAPLQARGIPILCQDVPPVSIRPTLAE